MGRGTERGEEPRHGDRGASENDPHGKRNTENRNRIFPKKSPPNDLGSIGDLGTSPTYSSILPYQKKLTLNLA